MSLPLPSERPPPTGPPAHADEIPLFKCGELTEIGDSNEPNYMEVTGEECTDGGKTVEWKDVSELYDVTNKTLYRCGQVEVMDRTFQGGMGATSSDVHDTDNFQGPYQVDGDSCSLLR